MKWFIAPVALGLAIGCASLPRGLSSDPARETARAAVLATAEGLKVADGECARIVRSTGDRELGEQCDAAYTVARATLVGAGAGVDAWDKVEARESVTCAIVEATRELARVAVELRSKGGHVPPLIDDAMTLARMLGPCVKRGGT